MDTKSDAELVCPFWQVRHKLSVNGDINFRGSHVFILPKFRKFVLDKFQSVHKGISTIKELVRFYFWWAGIDKDLEMEVKRWAFCHQISPTPPAKKVSCTILQIFPHSQWRISFFFPCKQFLNFHILPHILFTKLTRFFSFKW